MGELLYFVRLTLRYLLWVLDLAMLLRAIFSWIDPEQSNRFSVFLYMVTEPIIMPIQALLDKLFPSLRYFPLSISFLLAYMLLIALEMMLY